RNINEPASQEWLKQAFEIIFRYRQKDNVKTNENRHPFPVSGLPTTCPREHLCEGKATIDSEVGHPPN
ncbi:MAG TPA: hypothetical protein VGX03_25570, partial [Candidatus Binatia bacterium]|nr:hypothetical protein [Candidatus Binatia bacterium]